MNHGRVGHSCDGLIHQVLFTQSLRFILFEGLSLQEDGHYLLCLSVGMVSDVSLEDFILVMLGKLASSHWD